jgi:hypothetical protein
LREELKSVSKNNNIFKKTKLIQDIEVKHSKRMNYMMNNLIEKKKKQRAALDLLMKKKDHYVATLFLDED